MNKEKQEKKILAELKKTVENGDFQKIYTLYRTLIKLRPNKLEYWIKIQNLILYGYPLQKFYEYDELLTGGIELAQEARKYVLYKEQAIFFIFEFNFIIELIRLDGFFYSRQYPDPIMFNLLDNAIEVNTECGEAYYQKGILYRSNNEYEKAEENFNLAKNLITNDSLLNDIALNYRLGNKLNKVIETYLELLNYTKDDTIKKTCYEQLIDSYNILGDVEKVSHYKTLLST
ncbi:MAG: hypothetical protein RL662_112 [Bacteroidota bacterium]|jgi:tetratricopeptide (TPR) repeat protein